MRSALLDAAAALIDPLLTAERPRVLVGVTGSPGAGKSTLAERLAERYERQLAPVHGTGAAVAVPMDGFHLSQVELARLGLSNRKGAPETFDGYGFVSLLRRLRAADELVYAPTYSRVVHESIGSSIPIFPTARLLVVEGNYLLLDREPWWRVRDLLDLTIYLEVPEEERVYGLVQRQLSFGLDPETAHDWVHRSDQANAREIEASRHRADVVLSRDR